MYNYAQLNKQGYCIGISSLSGIVESYDMILLEEYDTSYLSRKFDRDDRLWIDEYLPTPNPQTPLTLEDIKGDITPIKETTSLTADDALTIMEYQTVLDEKLSKIITHLGL